jgi:hypothetical protein
MRESTLFKMPKSQPISETELVRAGELSAKTKKRLKDVSQSVTDDLIAAAYSKTESSRTDYMTNALLMGMLLLVKKQSIKHGHYQAFAASVWIKLNPVKALPADPAVLHNFSRSLREYSFLAQRFIADIEQSSFAPEYRDQVVTPPAVTIEDITSLVRTGEENSSVIEAIRAFVAGRSKQRMLIDFRAAETASAAEAAAEEADAAKRSRSKLPEDTPGQTLLDDILAPMNTIDSLMANPTFIQHSTKQFWANIADRLDTQARQARALSREIA